MRLFPRGLQQMHVVRFGDVSPHPISVLQLTEPPSSAQATRHLLLLLLPVGPRRRGMKLSLLLMCLLAWTAFGAETRCVLVCWHTVTYATADGTLLLHFSSVQRLGK